MANRDRKVRRVAFTINNYTQDELTQLHMCFEEKKFLYILGKEIGSNGTPHIQGYFEAKNPILFSTIKRIMPRAHIEAARGNKIENYKYCSKEGNYISNIVIEYKDDYKKEDYEKHLGELHAFKHNKAIEWILYEEWNCGIIYDMEGNEKTEELKRWINEAEKASHLIKVCKVCKIEIKEKLKNKLDKIFESDDEE